MIATLSLAFAIAVPMQVRLGAGGLSVREYEAGAPIAWAAGAAVAVNALHGYHPAPDLPQLEGGATDAARQSVSAQGDGSASGPSPLGGGVVRPPRWDVRRDAWFGNDKLRHFLLSMAATQFTYGGLRTASTQDDVALPIAIGVAAAGGVVKEVHDLRGGGPFSLKDLVWDAAGIAAAAILLGSVR